MARLAREENETLKARIAALEAKLESKVEGKVEAKAGRGKSGSATSDAAEK
jgi:BMFP domain-containing protein YqiC